MLLNPITFHLIVLLSALMNKHGLHVYCLWNIGENKRLVIVSHDYHTFIDFCSNHHHDFISIIIQNHKSNVLMKSEEETEINNRNYTSFRPTSWVTSSSWDPIQQCQQILIPKVLTIKFEERKLLETPSWRIIHILKFSLMSFSSRHLPFSFHIIKTT